MVKFDFWLVENLKSDPSFSGPLFFRVQPGETFYYPLEFQPVHQKSYQSNLKITNLTDGVIDEFFLVGIGTEPKPNKILKFDQLKCFKRQKVEIELPSLSENRRIRFNVTSELVDIFDGAKEVYTEAGFHLFSFCVLPSRKTVPSTKMKTIDSHVWEEYINSTSCQERLKNTKVTWFLLAMKC